ncbi:hypothetical protein [Streptomyces sp. NBC_01571]|uniref:hypothetical protein n=1 Tax=Streptomyces sp. NBC_01571 TaxID=2975883 RepID=UPI002B1CD641|nr:hypothetical protein [Streptomyces sp. NBC_01571]
MDALSRRDVLEWAMAESVPVRCPACRREHLFAASSYPCVCGAPVTPPLDRLADPVPVTHRVWDDDWVTVPCDACGREDEWPHPELGCACGTVLRIPVRGVRPGGLRRPPRAEIAPDTAAEPDPDRDGTPARSPHTTGAHAPHTSDAPASQGAGTTTPRAAEVSSAPGAGAGPARSVDAPSAGGPAADGGRHAGDPPPDGGAPAAPGRSRLPDAAPTPRPAFQPVTIRTARDAVTAAALYLRWLGYRDIRGADQRPPSGIGLAGRGVMAQVDPTVRPASLRDVECLWLTAMSESTRCVYFSLAGYTDDARSRADLLGIPLFVLDLTGTPQPVNAPADDLTTTGA